ncbi:MAG: hypothetical protein O3C21_19975, partial [Verrucomicrobia bacterium]|nr:hypothetical protein [Verrucomicrobiota bacterium]
MGIALRTGALLAADALLDVALLGDWEWAFLVIGKSAYQVALAFFAAFSSNLRTHFLECLRVEWAQVQLLIL